jgi:uncharacterized protein with GYD domain
MATYITTLKLTGQGVSAIKETVKRAAAFKSSAKKIGVKVTASYWTLGAFDGVIVFEAPDDQTATAAMLSLAALGNVATTTTPAFDSGDMEKIVGAMGG